MSFDKRVLERYSWLCEQVNKYDDLYWEGESPISDEMFDALVAELEELEAVHPGLKQSLEQQELPTTWSLERTLEETAVIEFNERVRARLQHVDPIEYVVEPKIDGCSLRLGYREGELLSVRTRGLEGASRDVTARVLRSPAICRWLSSTHKPPPLHLELRGEATVTLSDFQAINRQRRSRGWKALRTPLACVNQMLSTIDGPLLSEEGPRLEIHCHEVLVSDVPFPDTYDQMMTWLERWGLTPVPGRRVCLGIEQVFAYYEELLATRDRFNYEMDGIVLKVNRLSWQRQLGGKTMRKAGRQKRLPLWALAYKFPYGGELGTVARLTPTARRENSSPFEAEVWLEGIAEPIRATFDSETGPCWSNVYAGDTVRVRRPLGKVAEVISVEEPGSSRQNLKGITLALIDQLPTLAQSLATEIAQARGANVTTEISFQTDFVVVGRALSPEILDKAREVDAQIITEREFLSMLGLEMPVDDVSAQQLQLL